MMVGVAGLGQVPGQAWASTTNQQNRIVTYSDPTTGEVITEQWDEPTKSWVRITPLTGGPSQNVPLPPGFVPEEPLPGGWLTEADFYSTKPPPSTQWFPGIPNGLVLTALGLFVVARMAR